MQKYKLNFTIDVLMLILMMGLAGIGFLLEYVLVHGQEIPAQYGMNVDLYLFGLDRHDWGDIHLIMAYILLGLLVLHILLHWKTICVSFKRIIPDVTPRKIITPIFVISNLFLLTFFLFFKPEFREFERGLGRGRNISAAEKQKEEPVHASSAAQEIKSLNTESSQTNTNPKYSGNIGRNTIQKSDSASVKFQEKLGYIEQVHSEESHIRENHSKELKMVRGMFTLGRVAEYYNVPVSYITEKLGLPSSTSHLEKLGKLRKEYGFRMSDVEKIIIEYQKLQ